jgi:streptogramin lyase/single-stranded DNA-binding protein
MSERFSFRWVSSLLLAATVAGSMWGQSAARQKKHSLPDFDSRSQAASSEAPETVGQALARGIVARRLANVESFVVAQQAARPGTRIVANRQGLPKLFLREGHALSAPSTGEPEEIAKAFLREHAAVFPFAPGEVDQLSLTVKDVTRDATYLAFTQTLDGVPVFEGQVKFTLSAAGEVIQVGCGEVMPGLNLSTKPALSPEQATETASASVGGKGTLSGVPELVIFPLDTSTARLAWRVFMDVESEGSYEILVDAEDGNPLYRHNLYVNSGQARVWKQSPMQGSREMVTFDDRELPPGVLVTTGNNADAYIDATGNDQPDPLNSGGLQQGRGYSSTQVFDFAFGDGTVGLNPRLYMAASVTNLFYFINAAHKYYYDLGFTEGAGNFQTDNFGQGGAGNDAVLGEAQYGGFTDNASFSITPDGTAPHLRVGLWTRGTSSYTDDLDSDYGGQTMFHECGHGVSNRLVGARTSTSCLNQVQSGAMGEGWSDYFAISYYNNPVLGAYEGQNATRGIRRQSYEGYTFTYEDVGNSGYEVHNDGEIWAATLWDLRKSLGQTVTDRLVVNGLKSTPCSPSMTDARDSILSADVATNGGANRASIWTVFARHGMGYSASGSDGDVFTGTVYNAAYDLPPDLQTLPNPVITSTPPGVVGMGDSYSYQVTATNPNSGVLSFALSSGPAGMTIDSATGMIRWTAGFTGPQRVKVTVTDGKGGKVVHGFLLAVRTRLTAGAPIVISGAMNSAGSAYLDVPADVPVLQVTLRGGSGDADLFVIYPNGYYAYSARDGSTETLSLANPAQGRWGIEVDGYTSYSGVSLMAALPTPTPVAVNTSLTGLSGVLGSETFYRISPAGALSFTVSTSGGSGDVDLYLRRGKPAVCQTSAYVGMTCQYDARSVAIGNSDSITVTNPGADDWYLDLSAYAAYSGVTLTVTGVVPPADHWKGEYFDNMTLSGNPVLVRDDGTGMLAFDWGVGGPCTNCGIPAVGFSVRWTRTLTFQAGKYRFSSTSDDGMRVYVDGLLRIDDWKDHAPTDNTADVNLEAGTHTVIVEYYQNAGGATAKLSWALVSGVACSQTAAADHWKGEYFANMTLVGTPQMVRDDGVGVIAFNWGDGTPSASCNVPSDGFSVRWTRVAAFQAGAYHFKATSDDGIRVYVDGSLKIDAWKIQAPTDYTADVALSAGTHTLVVEYYDATGGAVAKLSWEALPCVAAVAADHWKGEYFSNPTLNGSPVMVRDDGTGPLAFDWGYGTPSASCGVPVDRFSARWTQAVTLDAATYRFHATVDDGVRLYVDGALQIDGWRVQAPTEYTADVVLAAGAHSLVMEYYEDGGGAMAKLSWEILPQCLATVAADHWKGEYFNNMTLGGSPSMVRDDGTGALAFDWGYGTPSASCGIPVDRFSARWTRAVALDAGMYRFHVTSDDGARLYVDGVVKIDQWRDQAPTESTADVVLAAGTHTLILEYYENTGGTMAKLSWELLPSCVVTVAADRWKGEYFSNMTLGGSPLMVRDDGTGMLAFDWGIGTPSAGCGIPSDQFSVRWTRAVTLNAATYRFTATSDDGMRLYVDGALKIDQWRDQATTVSTADVALTAGTHTLIVEYYDNGGGAVAKLSYSAPIGTIQVTTNLSAASFAIAGPATYSGSGTAWTRTDAPAGDYTITFGAVSGYTTPAAQTQTLAAGGTITFTGTYTSTLTPGITEFPAPNSGSSLYDITAGPDGNLWFTEWSGNRIGRITPSGTIAEFPMPTASSSPNVITTGPDGNLWLTEWGSNKVGRVTPAGVITEFPVPTTGSSPGGIVTGPDGNLWFTEESGNKIARMTLAGTITEFPVPTSGGYPYRIVVGSDSNLWFVEYYGNKMGRITTSGAITEFPLPTANSNPEGIAAGPDGNLWFTEWGSNRIGRITTSGTLTEFAVPTASSGPNKIAAGPDGNLWFTEDSGNNLGRITPSGIITEFPVPTASSRPWGIAAGPDGNLWFTEYAGNKIGRFVISSAAGTIQVTTNLSAATFTISGPAIYSGSGTTWTRTDAPAGAYTITFGAVSGYTAPASQGQTLAAGGTIAFTGTYSAVTTGTIQVTTNLSAATFTLSGPATYSGSGTSWTKTSAPAGAYTITFGAVSGYTTPAAQTKTLSAGGTITFTGTYSAVTTGNWQITSSSSVYGIVSTATGWITQSGNNLSGTMTLSGTPCATSGALTGTLSGNSLSLDLNENGQHVILTGTLAANGNSASGTYAAPEGGCTAGDRGTWSGTRTP